MSFGMANGRRGPPSDLSGRRNPRVAMPPRRQPAPTPVSIPNSALTNIAGLSAAKPEEPATTLAIASAIAAAKGANVADEPSEQHFVFATATMDIADEDTATVVAARGERVKLVYPMKEGENGKVFMTMLSANADTGQLYAHRVTVYQMSVPDEIRPFANFGVVC